MNTRQIILVTVAILLMVAVGVWWYFGFTLDFMRFFAAEQGVTDTTTDGTQQVQLPEGCELLQNGAVSCPRVSCLASQQSIPVGVVATIRAYGSYGGYTFVAPGGILSESNQSIVSSFTGQTGVRYDTPGIKQVLVAAMRGDDDAIVDVAACQITVTN